MNHLCGCMIQKTIRRVSEDAWDCGRERFSWWSVLGSAQECLRRDNLRPITEICQSLSEQHREPPWSLRFVGAAWLRVIGSQDGKISRRYSFCNFIEDDKERACKSRTMTHYRTDQCLHADTIHIHWPKRVVFQWSVYSSKYAWTVHLTKLTTHVVARFPVPWGWSCIPPGNVTMRS